MEKHTDRLEIISIEKLIPYSNNARTHSDEQIKKIQSSLREFGFVNPVLIDKDYGIIAGHGRIEAAKREGIREAPCVWVEHLTEAQKKAYILADNKLAELAGWDENIIKIEFESLDKIDFDISLTGFDDYEIKEVEKPFAKPNTEELRPYQKHHVLITCDAEKSPQVIIIVNELKDIAGVEIDNAYN